ncbi:hypothetical protein AAGW05_09540 [Arthrobacter sp. LAPM80]|uniref:hypothetical protein n=1 Tax=Arthrobacter sp. LAPM80 TaxID=3141788 RepID=UPI00398A588C
METRELKQRLADRWPATSIHGVATSAMLYSADISEKVITAAVERCLLIRLHRGAYIQSAVWERLRAWEREDAVLAGHVLASHSQGVYSHASAARLHGLRTWGCGSGIHLSHEFSPGSTGRSSFITGHRQAYPPESIILKPMGPLQVPVTTVAQTVVDCARFYGLEQSTVIGDHALRGSVTIQQLRSLLESSTVKRGSARASRLLEFLDPRSESAGESRTRVFMATSKLPMPELQLEIATRNGTYRADFAWPEYRLVLEFDGWGKYFDYRPTAQALAMERQREKDLMELGWSVVRINWKDLSDPAALYGRIRAALNRAGAGLPVTRTPVFA